MDTMGEIETAIGAVTARVTTLETNTGALSSLTTTAKNTLVAAINIATINGSGAGSMAKNLQDAKDYTDAETAKEVYAEAPTVTDASTDVSLTNTPASIKGVYLNGLRTEFYSNVAGVISFTDALETGDVVYVDYVKA
jgi:hypothetical protein